MAAYDPLVDYSDLIAKEAAKGANANRQLLAQYEAQRNAKIAGENLPYAQTALFTNESGAAASLRPPGYYAAEDRSDYINELYDEARAATLSALEDAYRLETAQYDSAAAALPARYRAAKNSAAADAAINRQSINEQFAASGLNTGAAGQARLSLAVAEQGALTALDAERAAALDELELQRARAAGEYRAAVAEAIAASELERAQALYDEAVRVESSYRNYSTELLAAWGLDAAGQPIAVETPAVSSGSGRASGSSRKKTGSAAQERGYTDAEKEANAELLRRQLSSVPGLTNENRATLVRDYYDDGRITYSAMQSLLRSIG